MKKCVNNHMYNEKEFFCCPYCNVITVVDDIFKPEKKADDKTELLLNDEKTELVSNLDIEKTELL